MNKKILSILLCIAMLVSCLSVYTYAEGETQGELEIDLGGLFDNEDEKPKEEEPVNPPVDDGGNTGNNNNNNNNNNNTGNNSGFGQNIVVSKPTEKDDKDTSSDKEEVVVWENPFADVKETDWYFETVKYVSENKIFNGMTENTFEPNTQLTRAMLVTILYRVAGSPRVASDSKFSDVAITDWYGAPVIWASENGIVNGISDTEFAPNNAITREQIAAIFYRYASSKGYDVSASESTDVSAYSDAATVSSYAVEAIKYTVGTGLMKGKTETTLNPQDKATRAEAATVITRFINANA